MPIPLEVQALVYWRTSTDLRIAQEKLDARGVADALYELLDLSVFTKRARMRRLCCSRVPIGSIGSALRSTRKAKT
jgi:hypothetical protein